MLRMPPSWFLQTIISVSLDSFSPNLLPAAASLRPAVQPSAVSPPNADEEDEEVNEGPPPDADEEDEGPPPQILCLSLPSCSLQALRHLPSILQILLSA